MKNEVNIMSKEFLTWLFFWGSWFWSIAYIFLFDGLRIGCKKGTYPVWSYHYLFITTICLFSFYKFSRYYGTTVSDIFDLSKALSFDRTSDIVLFCTLIVVHIAMTARIIKRFFVLYRSRKNAKTNG